MINAKAPSNPFPSSRDTEFQVGSTGEGGGGTRSVGDLTRPGSTDNGWMR